MTGRLKIKHISDGLDIHDLAGERWAAADPVPVDNYWSGEPAPAARRTVARLLWSTDFLYCLFNSAVGEPLVVSDDPDRTRKTMSLWERDVLEIFVAPDPASPNRYFEFEVAPTGEWVDLAIEVTPAGRITDSEYRSNMMSAAKVLDSRTLTAISIPFASLGHKPNIGDRWAGNLFRCVGSGTGRGYLAWQPTLTEVPNFHVPDRFGTFEFVK